jgi:glutamine amidotransferase
MVWHTPTVAIIDYGLGNLFSVARACERVGLIAHITSSASEIEGCDGVILPGVGAFGDAMRNLRRLDLVGPLRQLACSGKPLFGICLGLQLLLSESEEFGLHEGLGIIRGRVVHLGRPRGPAGTLKVPEVCWNRIYPPKSSRARDTDHWDGTPLAGLPVGIHMYFVHSFYVQPDEPDTILALTRYGDVEFCSAVRKGNVHAFQFHPERSGPDGVKIYRNIATLVGAQLFQESPHAA